MTTLSARRQWRWWHAGVPLAFIAVVLAIQVAQLPGDECSTGTDRFTRGNPLCIDSSTPPWLLYPGTLFAWAATGACAVGWWRARGKRT